MLTERKILTALIENKKPKTIREISKSIKASYRITHVAVKRLIKKKALQAEIVGKSIHCSLNRSHYDEDLHRAEYLRSQKILKNSDIRSIHREIMRKLKTSQFIFLVFGSYAKGTQTKHSDYDLMFISNEAKFEEKINDILGLLPIKTHPLVFNEKEFVRMKNSHKSNIVREVIKNNFILYGIEAYYRIKNVE